MAFNLNIATGTFGSRYRPANAAAAMLRPPIARSEREPATPTARSAETLAG